MILRPCSCFIFANSTIRIAFLAERPMSITETDLGIDIQFVVPDHQPGEGTPDGDRQAQQHAEGQSPALILGREDEKNEEERHAQKSRLTETPSWARFS